MPVIRARASATNSGGGVVVVPALGSFDAGDWTGTLKLEEPSGEGAG
jgi:hypothetical protein